MDWLAAVRDGAADSALEPHLEAQSLYQELVRHDPDNFAWAQEYYWVQIQLAKDQIRLGLLDEAHRNLQIVEHGMTGLDDDGRDVNIPRLKSALEILILLKFPTDNYVF